MRAPNWVLNVFQRLEPGTFGDGLEMFFLLEITTLSFAKLLKIRSKLLGGDSKYSSMNSSTTKLTNIALVA